MDKHKFIDQLTKLVAFESISGNYDINNKALDYVESLIDKKAKTKRIRNKDAEILLAGNKDLYSPEIGYLVHIDVVSGKPEQFKLKVTKDKLIGRGACDMKFSIPIGIEILNKLINQNSKKSFVLAITTDEEIGGWSGSSHLAEVINFRPKSLIVPDGGDNLNFVEKAKGVCQILIESKGSPAHASTPWKGKNAFEPLIKLIERLLVIYGKNNLRENWNTTMNIGQIQGGISTNQVCAEAIMKLDFRFPETDNIKNIFNTVKNTAKKIGPELSVSLISTGLPTFTNVKQNVVQNFLNSMKKNYKKKIMIAKTYGASDARHFSKFDIPILMLKPIGGNIHSDYEWISLKSCLKFEKALSDFIETNK